MGFGWVWWTTWGNNSIAPGGAPHPPARGNPKVPLTRGKKTKDPSEIIMYVLWYYVQKCDYLIVSCTKNWGKKSSQSINQKKFRDYPWWFFSCPNLSNRFKKDIIGAVRISLSDIYGKYSVADPDPKDPYGIIFQDPDPVSAPECSRIRISKLL